jgi:peptidoglycan/LPS O-acetylase OafA/YrhL
MLAIPYVLVALAGSTLVGVLFFRVVERPTGGVLAQPPTRPAFPWFRFSSEKNRENVQLEVTAR